MRFTFYAAAIAGTSMAVQVSNEYSQAIYEGDITPYYAETNAVASNEDEEEFLGLSMAAMAGLKVAIETLNDVLTDKGVQKCFKQAGAALMKFHQDLVLAEDGAHYHGMQS